MSREEWGTGSVIVPGAVMLLGRWEGNTLIVDVANNNDQTWFDVVGDFHSDALHVQERFTPVAPWS